MVSDKKKKSSKSRVIPLSSELEISEGLPAEGSLFQEPWVWGLSGAVVTGFALWAWNKSSIDQLLDTKASSPDSAQKMRELWDKVNAVNQENKAQDVKIDQIDEKTRNVSVERIQEANKILDELKKVKVDVLTTVAELNSAAKTLNSLSYLAPTGLALGAAVIAYPLFNYIVMPWFFGGVKYRVAAKSFGKTDDQKKLMASSIMYWRSFVSGIFISPLVAALTFWATGGFTAWQLSQVSSIDVPEPKA